MTDLLRVDVLGYPVYVKGENVREHLEQVSHQYAKMKIALYQVKLQPERSISEIAAIAAKALEP